MRREDLGLISINERLEDTLNVSPNRSRISSTIIISHKKAQEAQNKDWTSFKHGLLLPTHFVLYVPFCGLLQEEIRERWVS
jgi:hypothetical protein